MRACVGSQGSRGGDASQGELGEGYSSCAHCLGSVEMSRLGAPNITNLHSHVSGDRKSKIKASAGVLPAEALGRILLPALVAQVCAACGPSLSAAPHGFPPLVPPLSVSDMNICHQMMQENCISGL